ncbi:gamma-glutamylcyclotransferase [Vannielia litorea]|uniref:gamma-glutamylcyclotransferase n=1 Tax=Vannielia litorea TaxID=1217970 RepID=UPI0021BD55AE|nr:gamma-glutamylcyclotransferase [Vannielia litorea]
MPTGWWYSDAEREADRHATLATRPTPDLWVFAYGSLMWDPAFHFAEVRRARLPRHARRFILLDRRGGRGTPDAPGLMAALDECPGGPGCDGLAFRIPAARVETESAILWQRERISDGYFPRFVEARLPDGTVPALTFLANHASEIMAPDLPRAAQVEHIATGAGFLGSSADYLRNLARQFAELRIDDPEITALLADVEARIAALEGA